MKATAEKPVLWDFYYLDFIYVPFCLG